VNSEGISRPLSTPKNVVLMPAPLAPIVPIAHSQSGRNSFLAPVPPIQGQNLSYLTPMIGA